MGMEKRPELSAWKRGSSVEPGTQVPAAALTAGMLMSGGRLGPEFHQRRNFLVPNSPGSASDCLRPGAGLWAARKVPAAGRCSRDGTSARDRGLERQVSPRERCQANTLSRPVPCRAHRPWGSLPGFSSGEGCHFALMEGGTSTQGGRVPSWELGPGTPVS